MSFGWSFINVFNMLIYCSRNISYYHSWKLPRVLRKQSTYTYSEIYSEEFKEIFKEIIWTLSVRHLRGMDVRGCSLGCWVGAAAHSSSLWPSIWLHLPFCLSCPTEADLNWWTQPHSSQTAQQKSDASRKVPWLKMACTAMTSFVLSFQMVRGWLEQQNIDFCLTLSGDLVFFYWHVGPWSLSCHLLLLFSTWPQGLQPTDRGFGWALSCLLSGPTRPDDHQRPLKTSSSLK